MGVLEIVIALDRLHLGKLELSNVVGILDDARRIRQRNKLNTIVQEIGEIETELKEIIEKSRGETI